MAPEILLKHKYDARVDLWSVGVIMYECLFGKAPYSSSSFKELAEKIKERRPIEIPKTPSVSDECKDLLVSLLKHDPEERITFENFFSHVFLDFEHAPSKESYEKAVKLVQEAVKMDSEKKAKEAFNLYCEALLYFIPLLNNECDPKRKEVLRLHVNDYIKRAEKLKLETIDNENDAGKEKTAGRVEERGNVSTSTRFQSLKKRSGFCFQELRTLGKSTTGMVDALEIGEAAEQYLAEGNYSLALEKFQSSLSVLVPLLGKEPPGRRKDLLHKQVQLWMQAAESTKGLLATRDIETVQRVNEQCVIQ